MKKFSLTTLYLLFSLIMISQNADIYKRPVQTEPDRYFDVISYCLKLDIDLNGKKLKGQNTITMSPLNNNLDKISLNAVSLVVTDILDKKGTPLLYEQTADKLNIDLGRSYSYRDTAEFTVYYYLTEQVPGLRFIDKTENSPFQVSSDCFPDKARQWIPCYDYPHDKATQEMFITVDKKYKVLSNGAFVEVIENNNLKHTYHWKQNLPHSTYLINLSIADYAVIHDSLGSLPVNYWVYHWNVEDAKRSFAKTPYMIDFFNKLYGYNYPWDKYDQVISAYMGRGAEATSTTLLGEGAVTDRKAEIDYSYEGVIAHEIAHQ